MQILDVVTVISRDLCLLGRGHAVWDFDTTAKRSWCRVQRVDAVSFLWWGPTSLRLSLSSTSPLSVRCPLSLPALPASSGLGATPPEESSFVQPLAGHLSTPLEWAFQGLGVDRDTLDDLRTEEVGVLRGSSSHNRCPSRQEAAQSRSECLGPFQSSSSLSMQTEEKSVPSGPSSLVRFCGPPALCLLTPRTMWIPHWLHGLGGVSR